MKYFIQALFLILLQASCKTDNFKERFGKIASNTKWIYDTVRYFEYENNLLGPISNLDTANIKHLVAEEEYSHRINSSLYLKKYMMHDRLFNQFILDEKIVIRKVVNNDIESEITLKHSLNSNEYYGLFLDSTPSLKRVKRNKLKLDSLEMNITKGYIICGTAAQEILSEGFPRYRKMVDLNVMTYDSIMNLWNSPYR
jgi:hypothetical protein